MLMSALSTKSANTLTKIFLLKRKVICSLGVSQKDKTVLSPELLQRLEE
jgi:hypothetical protein